MAAAICFTVRIFLPISTLTIHLHIVVLYLPLQLCIDYSKAAFKYGRIYPSTWVGGGEERVLCTHSSSWTMRATFSHGDFGWRCKTSTRYDSCYMFLSLAPPLLCLPEQTLMSQMFPGLLPLFLHSVSNQKIRSLENEAIVYTPLLTWY